MFKELLKMAMAAKTVEQYNAACGAVDNAFNHDKIKWNDHEILYEVLGLVSKAEKIFDK